MAEFVNSSKERRPDTVSRDFLTAFCIGPIGISDTSQGAVARAWRLRLVGNEVLLAAAGETEWVDEIVWLVVPDGPAVTEVDIAFTQSADPVVCLERADGNIWIYWYDPTIPGLDLVLLGPGRNPKVVLDDPFDVTNSDVQLFYISDTLDSLVYRTQRERYANEHLTPVTGVQNLYLEDAIRDSRYRLHLVASERDQASGRYPKGFFNILSTQLFPVVHADRMNVPTHSTLFASVIQEIVDADAGSDTMMIDGHEVLYASLVEAVIGAESFEAMFVDGHEVTYAELILAVIDALVPPETMLVDGHEVLDAFSFKEITIEASFEESMLVDTHEVVSAFVEVA